MDRLALAVFHILPPVEVRKLSVARASHTLLGKTLHKLVERNRVLFQALDLF